MERTIATMPRASVDMKSAIINGQRRVTGNHVHEDKCLTYADCSGLEAAFFEDALFDLSGGSCNSDSVGRSTPESPCAAESLARVVASSD